ncbi:MAG: carbohydrate-binding domain-containing protein [Marinilabiliaceae bacterium]|nr:carbohydrate-binding domain-containing protein [Marinilabiliaceae bacterium]
MRRCNLLLLSLLCGFFSMAQERMFVHKNDKITEGIWLSTIDSIYFSDDELFTYITMDEVVVEYMASLVDSITFGCDNNVYINYNGDSVSIVNPYAFEGISIYVNGADVIVKSENENRDINYFLSGCTSNGSFKLYTAKRCSLLLNNVNITNLYGPAINIQTDKKTFIVMPDESINYLADGLTYSDAPHSIEGIAEDQEAVFFSEGDLEFWGSGSLSVTGVGVGKDGIRSDEFIELISGTVNVISADKDGIHGKEGVKICGATVSSTSNSGSIDGGRGYIEIESGNVTAISIGNDSNGIDCDSVLSISGGTVLVNVAGTASKGLKAGQEVKITGGTVTISTSGGVALTASGSGYDPSYCTAIKSKDKVTIEGGNITINGTGVANKGVSADGDFNMLAGKLVIKETGNGTTYINEEGTKDSYSSTAITVDGNITIAGGDIITTSTGSAGKGIVCDKDLIIGEDSDMPIISITTSGSKITISATSGGGWTGGGQTTGVYDEAKAIKCDGVVTISSGVITINAADDGIKSKTSVIQNGGKVLINKSIEGIESPLITINDGELSVVASDDAFNATYGTASGGTETNDGSLLLITGGYVVVSSTTGDAVDSNGNIKMTGGTLLVHGPTSNMEEAADFNGTFVVNGGFLMAAGTKSNMNKAMSSTSLQNGLYVLYSSGITANTIIRIQDATGNDIVTFKPIRTSYSFLFSSQQFANGTYNIYKGGTCTGIIKDGLYSGGVYSGGSQIKTFTVSGRITSLSF